MYNSDVTMVNKNFRVIFMQKTVNLFGVPFKNVGPLKIVCEQGNLEVDVPLATFESPLWPSVARGAKISRLSDGIRAVVLHECMTRSVLLQADNAGIVAKVAKDLVNRRIELEKLVAQSSNFAKLQDWFTHVVGNLLFIRFAITTGDAAGHNMVTKAAEILQNYLLEIYPELRYVSISGNYCTDKKVSAVNAILGRGKYVVADLLVPRKLCIEKLRATPEQIVALNIKKNLVGSIAAGGILTANAHFANMLFAYYLATGQDVANIVEGSQGITYAEVQNDSLYFSVTLPNIIVGSVGAAKDLEMVHTNLAKLGCLEQRAPGENGRRLAIIAASTVLCGELSLLAAQVNQGELMRCHISLER